MKQQTLTVAVVSMIVILSSIDTAEAGRKERSRVNKEKAEAWCANYSRTNGGAECKVTLMRKLCPGGYRKAKRFNRIRSNGYKSCVVGSKGHVIKKAVKKIHKPATALTRASIKGTKKVTKKVTIASAKAAAAPITSRRDQARKNKEAAKKWCAEYSRTHSGAKCKVVKRLPRNCPASLPDVGKRFKKFRSAGYKACIRK